MKRKIFGGTTGLTLPIDVTDTSSSTGAGLSGLVYTTTGLVAEYRRQGASTWTAITLAAGTLGTWSSGGFIVDGALPGAYELGLPDAAVATGARWVIVRLYGATNMRRVQIEIELDAVNYQSQTSFITGVNAIAPPANWNLMAVDGNGRVDLGKFLGSAVVLDAANHPTVNVGEWAGSAVNGMPNSGAVALTTAERAALATVILTDTTGSDLATPGSLGNMVNSYGSLFANVSSIKGSTDHLTFDASNNVKASVQAYGASLDPGSYMTAQGYTNVRAAKLDNLDAQVSSRLPTTGYTAPTNADTSGVTTLLTRLPGVVQPQTGDAYVAASNITSNSARTIAIVPEQLQRPTTGTQTFEIDLILFDVHGINEVPDSAPTIHARNAAGTSLDAGLSSTTTTLLGTGRYKATYTVASTDATGPVYFDFAIVVGGVTRTTTEVGVVADAYAVDFNSSDRSNLTSVLNSVGAGLGTAVAALPSASTTATAVWSATTRSLTGQVTIGSYSVGMDPAALMATAGYTSARAAKMDNLDATVSSRLATAGYTAPSTPPTAAQIATAIYQDLLTSTDFQTAGSVGLALAQMLGALGSDHKPLLSAATHAGAVIPHVTQVDSAITLPATPPAGYGVVDPWTTALPGGYTAGQAGAILASTIAKLTTLLTAVQSSQVSATVVSATPTALTVSGLTLPTANLATMQCVVMDGTTGQIKARLPISNGVVSGSNIVLAFAAPGFGVAPSAGDTVAIE